jgi:excisionase family DNA binding protein
LQLNPRAFIDCMNSLNCGETHMKTELNAPLYLRPAKAAKLLDVSRSTIYSLISSGEIRAIRLGGALRIAMADIDALRERPASSEE